jgi:PBP4 family serine-type D-alanyl-D-alanine carboxypeptidase
VEREWDRNVIDVTGTLPAGAPVHIDITVADPARYAAAVFTSALQGAGITISGAVKTGAAPLGANVVLKHTGPKIADYIKLMNKPSDNLLAESLIRLVGMEIGKGGSYDNGHAVESDWLVRQGIDTAKLDLADGCGVSRRDFVTARSVADLLVLMHGKADWQVYDDSLPIAGVDGTLRKRMKDTLAAGNVHAKTGSLGEVSCLSGYVTSKSGVLYVFSVLNNNFSGPTNDIRAMQDRFVEALAAGL